MIPLVKSEKHPEDVQLWPGVGSRSRLQLKLRAELGFTFMLLIDSARMRDARTKVQESHRSRALYVCIGFPTLRSEVSGQSCEDEISVAVETPGYWRCQKHGTF